MEYPKIHSPFKRDMAAPRKPLMIGDWALPEFEYLARASWDFTEKVDGTNIRVIVLPRGGGISFAGRTDNADIPKPLLDALEAQFDSLRDALTDKFLNGAILYGEGYGPKIQNGGKYRELPGFVLFDVLVDHYWLRRKDIENVSETFGIDVVPLVGIGTLDDAIRTVRGGQMKSAWGDFAAEGIVARPSVEMRDRRGQRIITKIKARDFP